MKTIDRLLQKLKERKALPTLAGVMPDGGGWVYTYHKVIKKPIRGQMLGKFEAVSMWYGTRGAALLWGRANAPKNTKTLIVTFVNMQHKDVSERLGKAKGKGYKVKGGAGVYVRHETETAVYKVTRPGRKL